MLFLIFICISTYIIYTDLRYRKIENKALVGLLCIGIIFLVSRGSLGIQEFWTDLFFGAIVTGVSVLSYKKGYFVGSGDIKYFIVLLFLTGDNIGFISNIGITTLCILGFWWGWTVGKILIQKQLGKFLRSLFKKKQAMHITEQCAYWIIGGYIAFSTYTQVANIISLGIGITGSGYIQILMFLYLLRGVYEKYLLNKKNIPLLLFLLGLYGVYLYLNDTGQGEYERLSQFLMHSWIYFLGFGILQYLIRESFLFSDTLSHKEKGGQNATFPFGVVIFVAYALIEFFDITLFNILGGL